MGIETSEDESGGLASRKSSFLGLSGMGRAKAASLLSAIETWAEAWAEAHEEGSEREAFEIEARLEDFAARLSALLGTGGGAWGWLREEFPENPLNWAAGAFAAGQPRHPGLWAARAGAAKMEFFLERGCPLRVTFARGRLAIDMGAVAGKSKSAGAFGVLERRFRKAGPEEAKRQIMAWLSGCASSLWAEGIRESARAFREYFPENLPDPYWGEVFASPLEELLWSPEAGRRPREAEAALLDLLEIAGEERWPMEADAVDPPEDREPRDHFESALLAGAWWALESLRCPDAPVSEERVARLREGAEPLDAEHAAALDKAFAAAFAMAQSDALEEALGGGSGDKDRERSGRGL